MHSRLGKGVAIQDGKVLLLENEREEWELLAEA